MSVSSRAVLWLRQLAMCSFTLRSVHVGSVVEKVALGQVCLCGLKALVSFIAVLYVHSLMVYDLRK